MANLLLLAAAGAAVEAHHEVEPVAFGLTPGMWVALSMAILIAIMVWKKVPGVIASGLDSSIAEIRKQLDEAKNLRAEAEARRQEDERKAAEARAAEEARLAAERAELARQREAQEAQARAEREEIERQAAELRAQQEAIRAFIREMAGSPLALHTAEANTQHYEVPTAFFQRVLGPRLKYSSGLWSASDANLA